MHHSYWALLLQLKSMCPRACAPQREATPRRRPGTARKSSPRMPQLKKSPRSNKDPAQPKINMDMELTAPHQPSSWILNSSAWLTRPSGVPATLQPKCCSSFRATPWTQDYFWRAPNLTRLSQPLPPRQPLANSHFSPPLPAHSPSPLHLSVVVVLVWLFCNSCGTVACPPGSSVPGIS